jgi:hypothetical protein
MHQEVTSDNFFNFVVTADFLIKRIQNDPSVPASAKADIQRLRGDKWLKVCHDLANASNNLTLNYSPITVSARTQQGAFGMGHFSKGTYEVTEDNMLVQLNDGTSFDCLELVSGAEAAWQSFFSAHGI